MPTSHNRVQRGFRRLAIIVGVVFALGGALIFGVLVASIIGKEGHGGYGTIALWLGLTALSFGIGWGITRVIGWVVAGFFSD